MKSALSTQAIIALLDPNQQRDLFYALEMIVPHAKDDDSIQTKLDQMEKKYFDLVWMARAHPQAVEMTPSLQPILDEKSAKYPGELRKIRCANGDWFQGFNSGALATARLLKAYTLPHNYRLIEEPLVHVYLKQPPEPVFEEGDEPEEASDDSDLSEEQMGSAPGGTTFSLPDTNIATIEEKFKPVNDPHKFPTREEIAGRMAQLVANRPVEFRQDGNLEIADRMSDEDSDDTNTSEWMDDVYDPNYCLFGCLPHGDEPSCSDDEKKTVVDKKREIKRAEREFPSLNT